MFIKVETKTKTTTRKILNFQIAGEEIIVNYKIGHTKTDKMNGSIVSTTYKAIVQSDVIKMSTANKVLIFRDDEVLYQYEKVVGAK